MHGGAVRRERPAQDAVGREHRRGLVGVEQPLVLLGEPARVRHAHVTAHPRQLGRRAGQRHRAAAVVLRVDALGLDHAADLADGVLHCPVQSQRVARRGLPRQHVPRGGEQRAAPAAVAPGGAEPGHLLLEHRDPESRVRPAQVVRRPQAGEPRADHHDVVRRRAGQRRDGERSRRPRSRATARGTGNRSAHTPGVGLLGQLEVHEGLGGLRTPGTERIRRVTRSSSSSSPVLTTSHRMS